jgi:hypothetical protein
VLQDGYSRSANGSMLEGWADGRYSNPNSIWLAEHSREALVAPVVLHEYSTWSQGVPATLMHLSANNYTWLQWPVLTGPTKSMDNKPTGAWSIKCLLAWFPGLQALPRNWSPACHRPHPAPAAVCR